MTRATPFDVEILRIYDARYLLGDLRDDFRTGLWCSTYVNSKLKASADPVAASDFMPFWVRGSQIKPKQSQDTMKAALISWARANGAVIPPEEV